MRIGIDATGLGAPKTGTVAYLTEILAKWNEDPSILHEFYIFVSPKRVHHFEDLGLDGRFRFINAPDSRNLRVLWQQTLMPLLMLWKRLDVHWGPGFVLPLISPLPMVVTIHDLTFELFPEVHETIKRFYFPAMIRGAVKKARRVLAISRTTMGDLNRLLPDSRGKTEVTLLAARSLGRAEAPPAGAPEHYALFLGTLEPRKNLKRLLAAWNGLGPEVRGAMHLVVVGATGWMIDELFVGAGERSDVVFAGQVTDAQLAQWMKGAQFLVYPSLYEGFGLPVVEAMAAGVPVLTSNVGATLEIAEGVAWLVDPLSEESIRIGLQRLIGDADLRNSLAKKGLERAAEFSWGKTARQTLDAIELAGQLQPHA